MNMKAAIIGSRSIETLNLSEFLPLNITTIVSGGAAGVDTLAAEYAKELGLEFVEFLPEYEKYGRSAPLIRNRQIVENCDEVFAFWDGQSRGTIHTVNYAKKLGKPVHLFNR